MRYRAWALAGVALLISGCMNRDEPQATVREPTKFTDTPLERSEATCHESIDPASGVTCTTSWRVGEGQLASSIRFTFKPNQQLVDGAIVLGFEGQAASEFYRARCDDVAFYSRQCPGPGRYRLLLKQGASEPIELWSRTTVATGSAPDAPALILTPQDQAVFQMFATAEPASLRAELQFVPNDPTAARMSKDVSRLFNMGGVKELALGHRLVSEARFAPGSYGR